MAINKDFEELIHLFNDVEVRYLIVDAYAVIFHTEPRYTKDIDFWIDPTAENAERVYRALKKFGAPLEGLMTDDLQNPEMVFQIGVEPNRIDIIMGVGGVDFDEAWKKRATSQYGDEKIYILSLEDAMRTKKVASRRHDQDDLDALKLKSLQKRHREKKSS